MNIKFVHSVPFTWDAYIFLLFDIYKSKTVDAWKLMFLFFNMEQKESSDVPKAKRGRKKKVGSCILWGVFSKLILTWEKHFIRSNVPIKGKTVEDGCFHLTLNFPLFCFVFFRLIMNKKLKKTMLQGAPLVTQVVLITVSVLIMDRCKQFNTHYIRHSRRL